MSPEAWASARRVGAVLVALIAPIITKKLGVDTEADLTKWMNGGFDFVIATYVLASNWKEAYKHRSTMQAASLPPPPSFITDGRPPPVG